MKKVKVIVAGAAGRMGKTILNLAQRDPEIEIAGAFERSDNPAVGRDVGELIGIPPINVPVHPDLRECIGSGGVVIDFTQPDATAHHVDIAKKAKCGVVIGTTGLEKTFVAKLKSVYSKAIPVVQSPNMSPGVNLLFHLVTRVGSLLGDQYDVEIVEEHHRYKKDAPSGTALELANLIAKERSQVHSKPAIICGRQGLTSQRKRGEIAIHAVRGGDIVGNHQVSFISEGERIELVHKASSREAFAGGALIAAKFIAKKKAGFYNMRDVLGL